MTRRFNLDVIETPEERKVRALNWVFEWVNDRTKVDDFPAPKHINTVVYSNVPLKDVELRPYEDIVCISDAGFYVWRVPYSEPGAPRRLCISLATFADLIRLLVQPRIVEEYTLRRFVAEPELAGRYKLTRNECERLKKEEGTLTRRDLEEFLKPYPENYQLYKALQTGDLKTIEFCAQNGDGKFANTERKSILQHAEKMHSGNVREITESKQILMTMVLFAAVDYGRDWEKGIGWESAELRECQTRRSEYEREVAGPLAKEYFSGVLADFCQTEDVLTIEKTIFGAYSPGTPSDYLVMMGDMSGWYDRG